MLSSIYSKVLALVGMLAVSVSACSDFYMNFTNFKLSARTMDLGMTKNWTLNVFPRAAKSSEQIGNKLADWPAKYGSAGMTGNWFGDEIYGFPSLFSDSLNEHGVSCSLLALVGTTYEKFSDTKTNVMAGLFCHYVAQNYQNVADLMAAMPNIAVWGPDVLDEHFAVRDATGASLVIEYIGGQQRLYYDANDGKTGYGIMTNEPTFDWQVKNIDHYEWKRTLARQAVATPGNFYPEERFLRVHMIKSGMQAQGLFNTNSYQTAISYTAQVVNTVSVPMGDQYGTDSGDAGGEGSSADHTIFAVIRDHADPTFFWRDAGNPTFRRLRLADVDLSTQGKHVSVKVEDGPYFIDVTANLK